MSNIDNQNEFLSDLSSQRQSIYEQNVILMTQENNIDLSDLETNLNNLNDNDIYAEESNNNNITNINSQDQNRKKHEKEYQKIDKDNVNYFADQYQNIKNKNNKNKESQKQEVRLKKKGGFGQVAFEEMKAKSNKIYFDKLMQVMKPSKNRVNLTQYLVEREKSFFGDQFFMRNSDTGEFIMCAKQMQTSTPQFHISLEERIFDKSVGYAGKLRGDAQENQVFYSPGESPDQSDQSFMHREEIGGVLQRKITDSRISQFNMRSVSLVIPALDEDMNYQRYRPEKSTDSLIIRDQSKSKVANIYILKTKEPNFDSQLKSQVSNYYGRVKVESVKNIQLAIIDDYNKETRLQFGKYEEDKFILDIKYPLSPFQAFCFCLTTFGAKKVDNNK